MSKLPCKTCKDPLCTECRRHGGICKSCVLEYKYYKKKDILFLHKYFIRNQLKPYLIPPTIDIIINYSK